MPRSRARRKQGRSTMKKHAPTPKEIRERFVGHYQPIVDLNTGAVAGFEALVRTVETDGSILSGGPFIEAIEADPEAMDALMWVILHGVARDFKKLFHRYPGFYVSVNVPPPLLGSERLQPVVAAAKLEGYLDRLCIEITERQALTKLGRDTLESARQIGVRVAIDDFGTGHSGLAQITGVDLDMIKIDRSLVEPALTQRTAARVLRGVVALASALRIRTVAEGVETWEQAFFLRAAGVDFGQGFFWSTAVPGAQAEALLKEGFSPQVVQAARKEL
jgi:EAL domain-containing protein (putative c-di-GMP-specific phosphodiesterase class I)